MDAVIIGAGGQARVVYEILRHSPNVQVRAFLDVCAREPDERFEDVRVVGPHSEIRNLIDSGIVAFVVGIGDNDIRESNFREAEQMGLLSFSAVHPQSSIADTASIGRGSTIATGATLATYAVVGLNAIVNTGAIIEHEVSVGNHAHISSGSILAGRVTVGAGAFVGAGSVVKEYVTIGEGAVIGAGSVVLKDIPPRAVAVGVPAKVIKYR